MFTEHLPCARHYVNALYAQFWQLCNEIEVLLFPPYIWENWGTGSFILLPSYWNWESKPLASGFKPRATFGDIINYGVFGGSDQKKKKHPKT